MPAQLPPPRLDHPAPRTEMASPWSDFRHGFTRMAVLNSLIGVTLWAAGAGALDVELVYSYCIGFSIWLIIQFGVIWAHKASGSARLEFPRAWRGVLLVAFAICAGWFLGTSVGNLYSGESTAELLRASPRMVGSLFLMTACIGVVASYHFYVAGKGAELARELEASRRQAAESQLMLLQSQLEPHMLFNTLANLRVLIGTDATQATQMLDRLNDYLRATLSASRSTMHPLSAEFDRLRDYLALMAVRMGPRLHTSLELPDDLRQHPVPPLLLQPLVENAIKHGLEPSVTGGQIRVLARAHDGQLLLEVSDSGVGLDDSLPPSSEGFGLTQVRERLLTAYGDRAGLSLDSAAYLPGFTHAGTVARVTIPLQARA